MMNFIKKFLQEEDGMSTVEIVIIIAVLVGLALLFRNYITRFVEYVLGKAFNPDVVPDPAENATPLPKITK
jgi:Flp pilus assembly pilin Flp